MFQVTKDMNIGEILDNARETVPFFLNLGMHCLGCPAARGESLGDACEVHGVSADEMVEKINETEELIDRYEDKRRIEIDIAKEELSNLKNIVDLKWK